MFNIYVALCVSSLVAAVVDFNLIYLAYMWFVISFLLNSGTRALVVYLSRIIVVRDEHEAYVTVSYS